MDENEVAAAAFAKAGRALVKHYAWYDKICTKISAFASMTLEAKVAEAENGSPAYGEICDMLCHSPGAGEQLLDDHQIGAMEQCHTSLHMEAHSLRAQLAVMVLRYGGGSAAITQGDMDAIAGRQLMQKATDEGIEYKIVDAPSLARH